MQSVCCSRGTRAPTRRSPARLSLTYPPIACATGPPPSTRAQTGKSGPAAIFFNDGLLELLPAVKAAAGMLAALRVAGRQMHWSVAHAPPPRKAGRARARERGARREGP